MAETDDLIPDGIYRIASAMNKSLIWDIDGESKSNGANLMLFSQNGGKSYAGNHQRFKVTTCDDGSNRQIFALHSGKAIDVSGGTAKDSANIIQYASHGGNNQKWKIEKTTNSTKDDCYYIKSSANSNFCIDASGGVASKKTNIILYSVNSNVQQGDHQKWFFEKDTLYSSAYPVPARVGASLTKTGSSETTLALAHDDTIYPAWSCSGSTYQLRYRCRGRFATTGIWDEWGDWQNPSAGEDDDPTENEGWGDPWEIDVADTGSGSLKHYKDGIAVEFGAYDCLQYQFEVQRFEKNGKLSTMATTGPVHGGSSTGTVTIVKKPTVVLSDFLVTAKGLEFSYASDFTHPNNSLSLTIKGVGANVATGWSTRGIPYQGKVTIPFSSLGKIPDAGSLLTVSYTFSTNDDAVVSNTVQVSLSYAPSSGLVVDASFVEADGYRLVASVGDYADCAIYVEVEQDGITVRSECEKISDNTFSVIPPVGREFTVFVAAVSKNNQWGLLEEALPAIDVPDTYIFNFGDQFACFPFVSSREASIERDYAAYQTADRRRESIYFGKGSKGNINLNGTVAPNDEYEHSSYEYFDALAGCGYAVLRTPDGLRYDVGIVSLVQTATTAGFRSVSITCKERS